MNEQDSDLIRRLAAIPYTGAISDILDESGYRNQVLPWEIRPIGRSVSVVGRAMTVVGEPTEETDPDVIFRPFLRMLGDLQPGDVIVSQANDDISAHLGELSSTTAQHLGATGAVIDGGVRDTDYIGNLGFPIFARYRTPRDIGGRWRLVDYNVSITIGATHIEPGDLIVGDIDGVVVVPRGIAESIVAKTEEVIGTEDKLRRDILNGVHPLEAFDRYGRF